MKAWSLASLNPTRSTHQSLDYRTFQRIERNPRVSARFAFACGPRERRGGRKSAKFRESSLRAISLCPTPWDRRRADWWVGAFRRRTFALLWATKSAESASHLAASEQCVLRTAGTPKSRPEKENRDEHRN